MDKSKKWSIAYNYKLIYKCVNFWQFPFPINLLPIIGKTSSASDNNYYNIGLVQLKLMHISIFILMLIINWILVSILEFWIKNSNQYVYLCHISPNVKKLSNFV